MTPLGHRQAQALVELADTSRIVGVYASMLQRTGLTAQPLADAIGTELVVVDGVHEIGAGDYEGSTDRDAFAAYVAPIKLWRAGDLDARISGGENGHEFLRRFDGAIARIGASHGHDDEVAVFSHAGAMRVWLGARVRGMSDEFSASHNIDNAGVIQLDGSVEQGWQLSAWQREPVGDHALSGGTAHDPVRRLA